MRELVAQIPDVDAFLALAPEELAAKILFLLRQRRQEMFTAGSLETELWGGFGGAPGPSYSTHRQGDVHLAFAEAWAWLEAQGLLVPAEGVQIKLGGIGWKIGGAYGIVNWMELEV
jgi:hypothetical protein